LLLLLLLLLVQLQVLDVCGPVASLLAVIVVVVSWHAGGLQWTSCLLLAAWGGGLPCCIIEVSRCHLV
jgi:hypothetical protein